jgi:hypothetical protein
MGPTCHVGPGGRASGGVGHDVRHEVVELEIEVEVPLIGGRLEKLMAEKVAAGMDVEHAVGVAWLEEH